MPASHQDNYHCFKGMGLIYWRDKARGLQPLNSMPGPQGHRMIYATDPDDGFALQNGGIAAPVAQILSSRMLIRFMPAGRQATAGLAGNWWLDADAYAVISGFALNRGMTLARAAQSLLVVPQDWSDCGQMLVARPVVTLMAYVGKGKPVALLAGRDTSPDARRQPGTRLHLAPQGTNLEQIYLPGERQFLPNWLRLLSIHRADLGSTAIPSL